MLTDCSALSLGVDYRTTGPSHMRSRSVAQRLTAKPPRLTLYMPVRRLTTPSAACP